MPTPDANPPETIGLAAEVTAALNPDYARRRILFSLLFLGFACWSLYDGCVRYPEQNRRVASYQLFLEDRRAAEWPVYAQSQGWSPTRPGPAHSPWDVRTQWLMACLFGGIGVVVLTGVLFQRRRLFVAAADGLHGFQRSPVPYAAIRELDRRAWERKGIARLVCELESRRFCLTLDDWKYRGMAAILKRIERERPDVLPLCETSVRQNHWRQNH